MKALEIGPGRNPVDPSWDTVDVMRRRATFLARWGVDRIPVDDDAYDLIYSMTVIEHLPWRHAVPALKEAYRVLKPGGTIEVWTQDFDALIDVYLDYKKGRNLSGKHARRHPMHWLNGRIFSSGDADPGPDRKHCSIFDEGFLGRCMTRAGFAGVHRIQQPRGGVVANQTHLGMAGTKPAKEKT